MPKGFSSIRLLGKYYLEAGEKWRWPLNGPSNVWSFHSGLKEKKICFLKEGKWLFLGEEVGSLGCDLCSGQGKTTQGCGATLGPSHLNTTSPQKHRGEGGACWPLWRSGRGQTGQLCPGFSAPPLSLSPPCCCGAAAGCSPWWVLGVKVGN